MFRFDNTSRFCVVPRCLQVIQPDVRGVATCAATLRGTITSLSRESLLLNGGLEIASFRFREPAICLNKFSLVDQLRCLSAQSRNHFISREKLIQRLLRS